ncbi:hypothetical protein H311_02594 [Anncaliia algerae PRA109]|nr:hypothetical protein H311_02594 [Anncaliia algerae PRA109]
MSRLEKHPKKYLIKYFLKLEINKERNLNELQRNITCRIDLYYISCFHHAQSIVSNCGSMFFGNFPYFTRQWLYLSINCNIIYKSVMIYPLYQKTLFNHCT